MTPDTVYARPEPVVYRRAPVQTAVRQGILVYRRR